MNKATLTGMLYSFLVLTGCGLDLYDLANGKRTLPSSAMQIDALFLKKTINNNDRVFPECWEK